MTRNKEMQRIVVTKGYLGLATAPISNYDTLATITEEDDAGYSRQVITFGMLVENGSLQGFVNSAEIVFGLWKEDSCDLITDCFISDAPSGTKGRLITAMKLDVPKQPSANGKMVFAVGALILT